MTYLKHLWPSFDLTEDFFYGNATGDSSKLFRQEKNL